MLRYAEMEIENTISSMIDLAWRYRADVASMQWRTPQQVFDGVSRIAYVRDDEAPECNGSDECTKRPGLTLVLGGDCDDKAIVVMAGLNLLGIPQRVVTVSYAPGPPTHVYVEALLDGQWVPMDTTHGDLAMGEERPYQQKEVWE